MWRLAEQYKCTAVVLQVCNPVRNTSYFSHSTTIITASWGIDPYDIYSGLDADSTHGFACKCHIVRSVWAAGVNGSPVCPEALL